MENYSDDPRYPIGKFIRPNDYTDALLKGYISTVANFPEVLKREVFSLNEAQLNTAYREGGWTVLQVVHHCADSHMNALIRFKLALTEVNPVIKPYHEALWAELKDYSLPLSASLSILDGVHRHLAFLWTSFSKQDHQRTYVHPEHNKTFTLAEAMGLYDWHCRHHLAHITRLKTQKGW